MDLIAYFEYTSLSSWNWCREFVDSTPAIIHGQKYDRFRLEYLSQYLLTRFTLNSDSELHKFLNLPRLHESRSQGFVQFHTTPRIFMQIHDNYSSYYNHESQCTYDENSSELILPVQRLLLTTHFMIPHFKGRSRMARN